MGEKQKGRGTTSVPSADQLRMAKLSIDPSDDASLQKLIKKVIETTRCSSSQAEVALLDNENDVQRAVLYILDRNGQVDCWMEQKSRKAKKEEAEKDAEVARRSVLEASTSRRGGRGASAPRPSRGTSLPRGGGGGGGMVSRGGGGAFGRGGGRGGRSTLPIAEHNPQSVPSVSRTEESIAAPNEEVDWKNGPLVYESTASTTASQPPPVNLPTAAGPMSFAAMAKKATAPPPPPPVVPVYVPPPPPADPEPLLEVEPEQSFEEEVVVESPEAVIEDVTPEEPIPESTFEELEENPDVAQSWTAELKTNLGIGLEEEKRPLRQRVEFMDTAVAAPLNEYQFGFSPPEPQPTIVPTAVPSPPETIQFTRSVPQHPVAHIQDEAKISRLSFDTTSSLGYPPSENRSMIPPRTNQPVVSQQAMFNQMPYAASYGPYMGMGFSPVGGRDDPYAMLQQNYAAFPQIDLSSILSNAAPRDHSDMSRSGRASENVVQPPPGFASNGAPFMAQPSLSSLLVQPPYQSHQYANFMMPSVSNRYEEERRKESRSTHQNTPPPSMQMGGGQGHYNHYQKPNYGSHKQYPSNNNWNN